MRRLTPSSIHIGTSFVLGIVATALCGLLLVDPPSLTQQNDFLGKWFLTTLVGQNINHIREPLWTMFFLIWLFAPFMAQFGPNWTARTLWYGAGALLAWIVMSLLGMGLDFWWISTLVVFLPLCLAAALGLSFRNLHAWHRHRRSAT